MKEQIQLLPHAHIFINDNPSFFHEGTHKQAPHLLVPSASPFYSAHLNCPSLHLLPCFNWAVFGLQRVRLSFQKVDMKLCSHALELGSLPRGQAHLSSLVLLHCPISSTARNHSDVFLLHLSSLPLSLPPNLYCFPPRLRLLPAPLLYLWRYLMNLCGITKKEKSCGAKRDKVCVCVCQRERAVSEWTMQSDLLKHFCKAVDL